MTKRLIFLHIPKTAGTAFHNVLMQHFQKGDLCPERLRFLDRIPDDELAGYRFYSGHFFWNQIERVPEPKTVITILRDPRKRLLSLYYYFRSFRWAVIEQIEKTGADSPRLAKENDLLHYLRSPQVAIRNYVDNAMTRHLIGLQNIGPYGSLLVSAETAYEIAAGNLLRADAFGISEHYGSSREGLERAIGFELPPELSRENTFEQLANSDIFEPILRQEHFDRETEVEIERNLSIDSKLYEWALHHLGLHTRLTAAK